MPAQFEPLELPHLLRTTILSKKCVAFIGSGPSIGDYDSWPELVNRLCDGCRITTRVHRNSTGEELLETTEEAKKANKSDYFRMLGDHFGRSPQRASLLYDALLALPFESYLTVNLDPLLSLKARTARIPCGHFEAYPTLDRKRMNNRSIHYLHGHIGPGSTPTEGTIVLSKSEFEAAYAHNSPLMNLLLPALENDPIVFVGCRLEEPVMHRVFSICKEHQQSRQKILMERREQIGTPPTRFILLPEQEVIGPTGIVEIELSISNRHAQEAYYRDMEITPVWYSVQGEDHSALRNALEDLAGLADVRPKYGWPGGDNAT